LKSYCVKIYADEKLHQHVTATMFTMYLSYFYSMCSKWLLFIFSQNRAF